MEKEVSQVVPSKYVTVVLIVGILFRCVELDIVDSILLASTSGVDVSTCTVIELCDMVNNVVVALYQLSDDVVGCGWESKLSKLFICCGQPLHDVILLLYFEGHVNPSLAAVGLLSLKIVENLIEAQSTVHVII